MESYDKTVKLELVTWQYQQNGDWKSFEDLGKGDSTTLEQAFKSGKTSVTLQHGYYQTFGTSW